ncbi:hypothetical protein J2Y48_002490 [Mycoplana sp. BE70]|uniref:hypothetical protein n=1 Tax=Mycoplana sp. BE70 TaxID=2817775 RepID=UPI00285D11FA|nr:hypothetical protein [Mycoplana sp. BE70]MDR6757194.1 hypothetical protein [Mycoplana sp. BE70]
MSSVTVKGQVSLYHQGNVYNCQINGHTVLADNETELFDTIGNVIEPEYLAPFTGNGFTWTFVRDDTAAEYDQARNHPEYRASAGTSTTLALGIPGGHFTSHGTYLVYPRLATYETIDWIDANAKHRVIAWTLPCTDFHFYLFEDAKEAMLFKLQFVG